MTARPAMRAVTRRRSASPVSCDVVARRPRACSASTLPQARDERRRAPRARSSTALAASATLRSTASIRRSAPTPASRSPPTSSCVPGARGAGARGRRRSAHCRDDLVRAMMFARVAGMARGGSGVSPAVLRRARRALNARSCIRVCPASARSASPILPPLSHIALAADGRRRAPSTTASASPANDALRRAGLAAGDARRQGRPRAHQLERRHRRTCARWCCTIVARVLDALHDRRRALVRGLSREPLAARPAGAGRAAGAGPDATPRRGFCAALDGSALVADRRRAARAGSAVVPLRHAGARRGARRAAHGASTHVEIELNSAADSPLVDRRRGHAAVDRQLSHSRRLRSRSKRWALRSRRRRRLAVERCHAPVVAALRPDFRCSSRATVPQHSGFATVAKNADRACQRDPPSRAIRRPRLSCPFRKASKTTRRWRRTVVAKIDAMRDDPASTCSPSSC